MRGRRSMLCRELVAYVYMKSEEFDRESLMYVYGGRDTLFTNLPDGMARVSPSHIILCVLPF